MTSSATTANPFPASPALADSIAAFNANKLVWLAISSIIFIIFDMLLLATLISFIDSSISFIVSVPCIAYSLADCDILLLSSICSILFMILPDISSVEAINSSIILDWSVAAFAILLDTFSILFALPFNSSAELLILLNVSFNLLDIDNIDSLIV